jgi:chromosome segregation ATPase
MSAPGAYEDSAAVGRRIGEARRDLGLTQADMAARIGVSLALLDRYETGKADPSGKLVRIAEVTGRRVSWFTSSVRYEVGSEGNEAELPTELGRRIAESRGRRGLTRRGAADERIAAALGEPSRLETEALSARADQPDLANTYRDLQEERTPLAQRLDELQGKLAEEQRTHGEAVAKGARLEEELERVTTSQRAIVDLLEQSKSELADSRKQADHLKQRVSELETELRSAEERALSAADRLERAEQDLDTSREQQRSLGEELDLRQLELSVREGELDTRETAVTKSETSIEDRRRALAAVELRAAEVERREKAIVFRERELEHRAGVLAELAGRLENLRNTVDVVDGRPPARQDEHLLIASNHGYRFVARRGVVPDPGEIVELEDGRYRCLRISPSPFVGDDRPCAVLEAVTAASKP